MTQYKNKLGRCRGGGAYAVEIEMQGTVYITDMPCICKIANNDMLKRANIPRFKIAQRGKSKVEIPAGETFHSAINHARGLYTH